MRTCVCSPQMVRFPFISSIACNMCTYIRGVVVERTTPRESQQEKRGKTTGINTPPTTCTEVSLRNRSHHMSVHNKQLPVSRFCIILVPYRCVPGQFLRHICVALMLPSKLPHSPEKYTTIISKKGKASNHRAFQPGTQRVRKQRKHINPQTGHKLVRAGAGEKPQ